MKAIIEFRAVYSGGAYDPVFTRAEEIIQVECNDQNDGFEIAVGEALVDEIADGRKLYSLTVERVVRAA